MKYIVHLRGVYFYKKFKLFRNDFWNDTFFRSIFSCFQKNFENSIDKSGIMEFMYLQQLKNAIHGCSKSTFTPWFNKVKMKRDKQFPKQTYQSECGKNFYSQFLSLWESLIPFCINVGGQSGCKAVHLDWAMPSWLAPTLLHNIAFDWWHLFIAVFYKGKLSTLYIKVQQEWVSYDF